MSICTNCSSRNPDRYRYCLECGTALPSSPGIPGVTGGLPKTLNPLAPGLVALPPPDPSSTLRAMTPSERNVLVRTVRGERVKAGATMLGGAAAIVLAVALTEVGSIPLLFLVVGMAYLVTLHARNRQRWARAVRTAALNNSVVEVTGDFSTRFQRRGTLIRVGGREVWLPPIRGPQLSGWPMDRELGSIVFAPVRAGSWTALVLSIQGTPMARALRARENSRDPGRPGRTTT